MSVNLSPLGGAGAQFFTNDGVPLTGGLLYTYLAGTSTPATAYTSSNGLTALANPIILDAAGRVPTGEIWLSDGISYKFVLKDSTDVLIATWDNLAGINSNFVAYTSQVETATATAGQTVFNLSISYLPNTNNLSVFVNGSNQVVGVNYTESDNDTVTFLTGLNVGDVVKFTTASPVATNAINASNVAFTGANGTSGNVQDIADPDGSDWIGYNQGSTGATDRTVQDKLQESVSVKDFGAVGNGTADDTAAIQAAIDYAQTTTGINILFPLGTYKVTDTLTLESDLVGLVGNGAIIVATGFTTSQVLFDITHSATTVFPAFQTLSIEGLELISNTDRSGICFSVAGVGIDQFASQIQYKQLSIKSFNIGFQYGSYAFTPNFIGCSVVGVNQVFKSVSVTATGGHYVWDRCLFTEIGNFALTLPAFEFGGLNDHYFRGCDIEAAKYTAFTSAGADIYFNNCHFELDVGTSGANASLFVITGGDYGSMSFEQNVMFIWQSTSSFPPFVSNQIRMSAFILINNRIIINTGITPANTTFLSNYYLPFLTNNSMTLAAPNNPKSGQSALLSGVINNSLSNWDFLGAYTIDFTQNGTGAAVSTVADVPYGAGKSVEIPPNRFIVSGSIPVPNNAQMTQIGFWVKQTVAGVSGLELKFFNANGQQVYQITPTITPASLNTWQIYTLGPTDNAIVSKYAKTMVMIFTSNATANTRIAYPFADFA